MASNGNEESFFQRLKKAQIVCSINSGQKFVPLDVLEKEITEENVRDTLSKGPVLTSRVTAGLRMLRIIPDDPLPQKVVECAKKVFAILVIIGEPDAIKELLDEGLTDEHLPLHLDDNDSNTLMSWSGKAFESVGKSMCEQRVNDFVDRQWIVMAPILDTSGKHIELDRRTPLPFKYTDEAGHGQASRVHKCLLHPAHYHGSELYGNIDYVATKEIWTETAFKKERENLETLATLKHDYLIRHLTTYKRDTTHYVVFPWADGGNLRDFWIREDELVRDEALIRWSLQQMLGIAEAVEALHHVNCRHGDLKPDNILHFKEIGDGRLVVADVGVSRTHDKATKFRHVGTTTRATTPSYEAPEAFTNLVTPRSRKYDIWSLGCIFLEFALWLLHDWETIETFSHARHAPDFEFYLLNRDSSASKRRPAIHPEVTKALQGLRQDPRCQGDTTFGKFLDLIEKHLLQVEVDERASADKLVQDLRAIVQPADENRETLFNHVESTPAKLRFIKRQQTGFEPINSRIVENSAE